MASFQLIGLPVIPPLMSRTSDILFVCLFLPALYYNKKMDMSAEMPLPTG
jgi:hypothetical protein